MTANHARFPARERQNLLRYAVLVIRCGRIPKDREIAQAFDVARSTAGRWRQDWLQVHGKWPESSSANSP